MVVNGCPASGTLVRLEEAPSTYQSRYSFMFPKIGIQGRVDLQVRKHRLIKSFYSLFSSSICTARLKLSRLALRRNATILCSSKCSDETLPPSTELMETDPSWINSVRKFLIKKAKLKERNEALRQKLKSWDILTRSSLRAFSFATLINFKRKKIWQ